MMDNDELLFQLSVYSDTACPPPDDTHRRYFQFADTAPVIRAEGWITRPTQADDYVVGQAVRYGDTVIFCKSRSGSQETFTARVLAILPAVDRGVFFVETTPPEVAQFCAEWTWLETTNGEENRLVPPSAFQAHEQQIMAVKRGPMWDTPTNKPGSR